MWKSNLFMEDINEARRSGYKLAFGFEVFPRLFIKNTESFLMIVFSWLFWQYHILRQKKTTIEYGVQYDAKTIRKGVRYYLTFGLYTK